MVRVTLVEIHDAKMEERRHAGLFLHPTWISYQMFFRVQVVDLLTYTAFSDG